MDVDVFLKYIFPIAVAIASVYIAILHSKMQKKILTISNATKSILVTVKSYERIKKNALKFFPLKEPNGRGIRICKIVFPVENKSRPLPVINQGDFYAINIITDSFSRDLVKFYDVPKNNKISADNTIKRDSLGDGAVVYVCSPQSNRALNKIYPYGIFFHDGTKCAAIPEAKLSTAHTRLFHELTRLKQVVLTCNP